MWGLLILCYIFWDKIVLFWQFMKMLWRKNLDKSNDDKILAVQLVAIDVFAITYEYIRILLKLNSSSNMVHSVSKREIEVEYSYAGQPFRFRTKIKKGPNKFLVQKIYDKNEVDVTDTVKQYLGPAEDWHGQKLTTQVLGFDSLTFLLQDDKKLVYNDTLPVIE